MSTPSGSWRSRRTAAQLAAYSEWWQMIESQAADIAAWQATAWARWDKSSQIAALHKSHSAKDVTV